MSAGKLSHRIELHSVQLVDDGFQTVEQYALDSSVWAEVWMASQKDLMKAGQTSSTIDMNFKVRRNISISVDWRIVFDEDTYDIQSIDNLSEKNYTVLKGKKVIS